MSDGKRRVIYFVVVFMLNVVIVSLLEYFFPEIVTEMSRSTDEGCTMGTSIWAVAVTLNGLTITVLHELFPDERRARQIRLEKAQKIAARLAHIDTPEADTALCQVKEVIDEIQREIRSEEHAAEAAKNARRREAQQSELRYLLAEVTALSSDKSKDLPNPSGLPRQDLPNSHGLPRLGGNSDSVD